MTASAGASTPAGGDVGADLDRAAALAWAAAVRDARRQLGERLGRGELDLAGCLDVAAGAAWSSTSLRFVLESLPGARRTDTRRTLSSLGLDPDAPIGSLSSSERGVVLATFPLARPTPSAPPAESAGAAARDAGADR